MAEAGKKTLLIEYYRSKISTPQKHKKVVKGLGFTRLNQIVEREDTPFDPRHGEGHTASGAHRRVIYGTRIHMRVGHRPLWANRGGRR